MVYLRVKKEADQTVISNPKQKHNVAVANELYTLAEVNKKNFTEAFIKRVFERVEISKKRVYWFFGCRFEFKNDK